MQLQPYLFFNGRCEEAIEFYQRAVGAKVEMLMRHRDMPEPNAAPPPPDMANKVLHAAFRIGDTTVLASDGRSDGQPRFEGFSLALSAPSDVEAQRLFAALSDGGVVHQPLIKTFFSSQFGLVADRFGVSWMVLTAREAKQRRRPRCGARGVIRPTTRPREPGGGGATIRGRNSQVSEPEQAGTLVLFPSP